MTGAGGDSIEVLRSMHPRVILLLLIAEASTLLALPCSTGHDPNPAYPPGLLVNCSQRGRNQIPRGIPLNATTLLLSGNKLTKVPNDVFSELRELRELDLSSNLIATLQHNAFRGLGKLIALTLWNNNLVLSPRTYPEDVFTPLVSLRTLVLNGNARHVAVSESSSPPRPRMKSGGTSLNSSDRAERTPLKFRPENLGREASDRKHPSLRAGIRKARAVRRTVDEAQRGATTLELDEERVTGGQDAELGYPDDALSHLHSLRHLALDGLTNQTLGHGFASLTQLTHLDMNGKRGLCKLVTLHAETLANLHNVTHLNLSDCNILSLTQDAFSSFKKLLDLDLSFNQALGFDLLGEAFAGLSQTELRNLTIDSVVPARSLGVIISSYQLRFFRNLGHLETLQARFNRIVAFENGALCSGMPPNLRYVNVNGNLFELAPYINDLWCLGALEQLDMNGLNTYWTPPLRPPDPENVCSRTSCQTQLTRREHPKRGAVRKIDHGRSTQDNPSAMCQGKQFSVPPKLKTFRARDFGLLYKLERVRVNASNSLKRIELSENQFPVWEGRLCGFHDVTELYLMDTMAEYIDHDFFSGFPALEILNISGNRLREVFWNDDSGEIFQGLKNLRVLDMSRNDLGHVPNETLRHLDNLEELYMRVNGMGTFTLGLTHMKKLRHLDISKNQLHTIPKPIRDHMDRVAQTYNVTINMTFNPIACICSNIDFLGWIRDSQVNFGTTYNYFCLQSDGSLKYMDDLMGTITELDRTCGSFVGIFVGASACCVIVVVLMVVALAYRFRWKLRYLYYASRLGLQRRSQQEQQQHFHYDAFVSFASEDNDFVNGELKRCLEDEQGLRLCIHTRDFVPGQYIASNIVDSVQRSRRTLVVLTRALLDSDWCHYELQMALMEGAHTGRDVLLFLLYEHMPADELSRDMLANLQATVYMEFPHDEDNRALFWGRLAQALRV